MRVELILIWPSLLTITLLLSGRASQTYLHSNECDLTEENKVRLIHLHHCTSSVLSLHNFFTVHSSKDGLKGLKHKELKKKRLILFLESDVLLAGTIVTFTQSYTNGVEAMNWGNLVMIHQHYCTIIFPWKLREFSQGWTTKRTLNEWSPYPRVQKGDFISFTSNCENGCFTVFIMSLLLMMMISMTLFTSWMVISDLWKQSAFPDTGNPWSLLYV